MAALPAGLNSVLVYKFQKGKMYMSKTDYKVHFLKLKHFIHPLIAKAVPLLSTTPLQVIGSIEQEPCLIITNHLCIEDIPTAAQAVGKYAILLASDEELHTLNGIGMNLNGTQWVRRLDKGSRANAQKQMVALLKKGYNCCMYPEATWNLSPNLLMLPMNYGCIRIALEAGVPLIPAVSWFEQDKRCTRIGQPFFPETDLVNAIRELRDRMAELVFSHISANYQKDAQGEFSCESRDALAPSFWNRHVEALYDAYPRAKADKEGCRRFESQFITTPKTDEYCFFQEFNSLIRKDGDRLCVQRISSDPGGFYERRQKTFFGWGYNETKLNV